MPYITKATIVTCMDVALGQLTTVSKNTKWDNPSDIYSEELGIKSNTHKHQIKHHR